MYISAAIRGDECDANMSLAILEMQKDLFETGFQTVVQIVKNLNVLKYFCTPRKVKNQYLI